LATTGESRQQDEQQSARRDAPTGMSISIRRHVVTPYDVACHPTQDAIGSELDDTASSSGRQGRGPEAGPASPGPAMVRN